MIERDCLHDTFIRPHTELSADPIIRAHLSALYDTLLEQNLLRIIEPYSRVEIDHVASSVGQPVREVEVKLSQMILDKTLAGVLDQSNRSLIVFEDRGRDVSANTLKGGRSTTTDYMLPSFNRRRTKLPSRRCVISVTWWTRSGRRRRNCRSRTEANEVHGSAK